MTSSTALSASPARLAAQNLREVACDAARSVGPALLAAFRQPMEMDTKADFHDLVTIHDRHAEEALKTFIAARVPGSRFIGEEGGVSGDGPVHWYIDPIDGTSNFAAGMAFWCVSIGAVRDGEIVAGAVFDPVSGHLFSADLDGAFCDGLPLRATARPRERDAMLITGYPVERDFRLDGRDHALDNFATLSERFATVRRPGSAALSLCHVAAGWADAAMGFGVNAWDVTASILILRQAGGRYDPYRLGKVSADAHDFECPGYVAVGQGGTYPTLGQIAQSISSHREHTDAYRSRRITISKSES